MRSDGTADGSRIAVGGDFRPAAIDRRDRRVALAENYAGRSRKRR